LAAVEVEEFRARTEIVAQEDEGEEWLAENQRDERAELAYLE
jgi:hypothetical protein